jgi:predicted aspartyl protease
MSAEELRVLEDKNNRMINQLHSFVNPTPQAPSPTQVEDVENLMHIVESTSGIKFQLNLQQRESTNWRKKKARREHKQVKQDTKEQLALWRRKGKVVVKREKRRERKRTIVPSIVVDTGATSTVIRQTDAENVNVLPEKSNKTFLNANGTESKAGNKAQLKYNLRSPATEAEMVPGLALNSLLSASKLANANYVTLFTKNEVQVFDAEASKFKVKGEVVMKGWRCPETKLWRIPLVPQWTNNNTETALLSQKATDIMVERRKEWKFDLVNSVYELPNTEQVVAWYHAAAGYPTKATWLKAIEAGFYATWPMLTAKAVRKHFPEHDETHKKVI